MLKCAFLVETLNGMFGYSSLFVPAVWMLYEQLLFWLFLKKGKALRNTELFQHF